MNNTTAVFVNQYAKEILSLIGKAKAMQINSMTDVWAFFGQSMLGEYIIQKGNGQRKGQAFMNAMSFHYPSIYKLLTGSPVDPFYHDSTEAIITATQHIIKAAQRLP